MAENQENWLIFDDSMEQKPQPEVKQSLTGTANKVAVVGKEKSDWHCQQYLQQNKSLIVIKDFDIYDDSIRVLTEDAPRMEYRRRTKEMKTVRFDKYLAPLVAYIEFLITCSKNDITDVCFSRNIQFPNQFLVLIELFPKITFHVFEIFSKSNITHDHLNFYNFSVDDQKFEVLRPKMKKIAYVYEPAPAPKLQLTVQEANDNFKMQLQTQLNHCQSLTPSLALCNF